MNDEIKEIINNMKEISSFEYTTDWFELNYKDTRILLDYITNLQQENEILKERCNYLQRSCDRKEEQRDDTVMEYMQQDDYKSRNEKAISILNKRKEDVEDLSWVEMRTELYCEEYDELINALKGDDEKWN